MRDSQNEINEDYDDEDDDAVPLREMGNPDLEEHFVSIYSYTMDSLFGVANYHLNNAKMRAQINDSGIAELADEVRATLPWFKKLAVGLHSLPPCFEYSGTLYRVTRFVFSPTDLSERFRAGNRFVWHTFRSTSASLEILDNPHFSAARSTVFEIHNAVGKCIWPLSQYREEREVLLPIGATFQVIEAWRGSGEGDDICKPADWIILTMLPQVYALESGISMQASWL